MSYYPPASIPRITFAPYESAPRPRHPVGTLPYDQDYNHDLMFTKVQLRKLLKINHLSGLQMGFPFHCVHNGQSSPLSSVVHTSYEFQFREHLHSLEQRSGMKAVTFRYSSPSSRTSGMMEWRILAPERQSLRTAHPSPGVTSIAHVQVDPRIMETPFGFLLMTDARIVQEALAISIEIGVLVTIQVANYKNAPNYPVGEILFLSTDSRGRSKVECNFRR